MQSGGSDISDPAGQNNSIMLANPYAERADEIYGQTAIKSSAVRRQDNQSATMNRFKDDPARLSIQIKNVGDRHLAETPEPDLPARLSNANHHAAIQGYADKAVSALTYVQRNQQPFSRSTIQEQTRVPLTG